MIGGFWEGDKVAKLSDQIVVQYGMGITSSEAAVQELVYNTVDRDLVHVPKVYRFVRSDRSEDPRGYLFLEYVQGQPLEDTDLEPSGKTVRQIAGIIFRLGQIQNPVPGPLGGGLPLGYIYGDDGAKAPFTSIRDMNAYMNKRLEYRNDTIDLSPYPLVLCHGDICRRNIILEDDGSICLVDWGYAGFYPRFFEVLSMSHVNPYDAAFEEPVKQEVTKALNLTVEEEHDMKLMSFVRGANLRWSFDERTPSEIEAYHASQIMHFSGGQGPVVDEPDGKGSVIPLKKETPGPSVRTSAPPHIFVEFS
ncbi:kinase-like domain-containing protein [Aspergillus lucknowensis]|uniref:Kinase-like domain-containing protein n=1 Tax=Aspergillus lucknowensis TaxID=176173 RepID=A0ABR4LFQ2_9EURO